MVLVLLVSAPVRAQDGAARRAPYRDLRDLEYRQTGIRPAALSSQGIPIVPCVRHYRRARPGA